MLKPVFTILLGIFLFNTAFAQKDTVVYYLKSNGKTVSTKDSADYFLVILPPDTNVDKKLFVVRGFYPNGKMRLIGNTTTNNLKLTFQGTQILFFPNGHKQKITQFDRGEPTGDVIEYYPNGKLYNIKTYTKNEMEETELQLKSCNDSTGNVLAQEGNGRWIKFLDESFKNAYVEGVVKNGHEQGEWHGKTTNGFGYVWIYKNGKITSSFPESVKSSNSVPDNMIGTAAQFPGGLEALMYFVARNTRYPEAAKEKNIQGRVIVSFVIDRDGKVINVRVIRGIGDGCDEEAARVIRSLPKWKPAIKDGNPVNVSYTVPVEFHLTDN